MSDSDLYLVKLTSNACVNVPIIDLYIQDNLCEFQSTVDVVKWVSLLKQGNDYLKDTPQTVTSANRDIVWVITKGNLFSSKILNSVYNGGK